MKLRRLAALLLVPAALLGQAGEGRSQSLFLQNPPFTINRKVTMAQANRGGRVELDYDLRPLGASKLTLQCFRFDGVGAGTPVRDWTFSEPRGHQRLAFSEMPSAVYYFTCSLQDAAGQPLPSTFRPVQLEYGGWTGRLRNERNVVQASQNANKPFGEVKIEPTTSEGEAYTLHVEPASLVVAPGRQVSCAAMLNKVLMLEPLTWKLEGPGRLAITENCLATYLADKGGEGSRATIHVESQLHPNLQADVHVLVTGQAGAPAEPTTEKP